MRSSAAAIHSRRIELPLLRLAAACVPASRGSGEEAERHARLAEEAAASVDYGQERVYAGMTRALICQAAGDYLGMADAVGAWQDDSALDGRSRLYAVLSRPLLAEGLVGSGQLDAAEAVLGQLRAQSGQVSYIAAALAWLEGWLAEQRGDPEQAGQMYVRGQENPSPGSPVHTARLLLAHGRLLRRGAVPITGKRSARARATSRSSSHGNAAANRTYTWRPPEGETSAMYQAPRRPGSCSSPAPGGRHHRAPGRGQAPKGRPRPSRDRTPRNPAQRTQREQSSVGPDSYGRAPR